jgi:hypothetical protein
VAQEVAQGSGTVADPKAAATPTIDEIRTAALHLLELAAAYEGRGVVVAEGGSEDPGTLAKAVGVLLTHRAEQRRRQRDAVVASLTTAVSEDYRNFGDDESKPALWLWERALGLCNELGLKATDSELGALVIDRKSDDRIRPLLKDKGTPGPVVTAEATLAEAIGLSERTVATARANSRRRDTSTLVARHAFGRWVPKETLEAYCCEVVASPQGEAPSLSDLATMNESHGRHLDLAIERLLRSTFTTESGLLAALTMPPQGPVQAAFQEGFNAVISRYHETVRGFALEHQELLQAHGFADRPDLAPMVLGLLKLPEVGEAIVRAARALTLARLAGSDDETIAHAERVLREAVQTKVVEDACRHFDERFSPG